MVRTISSHDINPPVYTCSGFDGSIAAVSSNETIELLICGFSLCNKLVHSVSVQELQMVGIVFQHPGSLYRSY